MLKIFFSTFFLYNTIQAYQYVKDKYSYQYEDWLINYSHGFVRRGLIGELIIKFSHLVNANLQFVVFFFLLVLSFFFYYQSYKLFSKLKINLVILFLIFSPLYFTFYLFNHGAGIRKEFFIFIFFCYLVSKLNIKNVKENLWKFSFSFPVLILIHEGLIFYMSFYVLFVLFYLTNKNNFTSNLIQLSVTIFLSILIFYLSFIYKGSEEHVLTICNSLNDYVKASCTKTGAINTLKNNLNSSYLLVYNEHDLFSVLQWLLISIYAFAPVIYLLKNSNFKTNLYLENFLKIKSKNFIIVFLFINFVSILPLFFIAFDWGRWLSIYYHLVSFAIIFLIKNKILVNKKNFLKINSKIIIILILYSTFITPSVFDQKSSDAENVYKLNYIRILKKLN